MLRASITCGVVLSFIILLLPAHGSQSVFAQQPGGGRGGGQQGGGAAGGPVPAIDARTSGMQKIDGYFPLYWDERTGSLFLEIPRFDTEFLFSTGLSAGLGSNDIGLDRGAGGGGRIVSSSASARASCSCSATSRSARAARIRSSASRSRIRSPSRCCGASRSPAESERPRAGRRDRLLPARRARRRQRAAARHLPRRSHAQRVLSAEHEGISRRTPKST